MEYDAVVFDMDGVVIERSPSWVFDEAAEETLAAFGIEDPPEEDYNRVRMGPESAATARERFGEEYGVAFEDVWATRAERVTANQLEAIRAEEKTLYGDVDALEVLPAPRAIVSNNQHAAVETVLEVFELESYFEVYYGIRPALTDLDRRKPDPTNLRRALGALGAEHAVYVGDRASDVAAADRAGMDAAFLRRSFNGDETFEDGPSPTYDLESLHELVEVLGNGHRPS